MTCASCRHWNRQGAQIANATRDPGAPRDEGTCEARAPVLMHFEAGDVRASKRWPVPLFPRTHESRSCGEWGPIGGGNGDGGERIIAFQIERTPRRNAA